MTEYGLIGYPLGHSFSAAYFAEKFQREGIDATYCNFELASIAELRELVARRPLLRGLNVTIPHKQAVIPHLDALTPTAQAIGAVNVISVERREGKRGLPDDVYLTGHNTDVIGFVESLRPLLPSVAVGKREEQGEALILGSGGAARAVAYGLRELGYAFRQVSRKERTDGLTYESLTPEVMARAELIVNCTPLGMYPRVETAPEIPYSLLTARHLLYDLVYNPQETEFLRQGRARGATVKNGLEMLHLQAEAAWRIWTTDHVEIHS